MDLVFGYGKVYERSTRTRDPIDRDRRPLRVIKASRAFRYRPPVVWTKKTNTAYGYPIDFTCDSIMFLCVTGDTQRAVRRCRGLFHASVQQFEPHVADVEFLQSEKIHGTSVRVDFQFDRGQSFRHVEHARDI